MHLIPSVYHLHHGSSGDHAFITAIQYSSSAVVGEATVLVSLATNRVMTNLLSTSSARPLENYFYIYTLYVLYILLVLKFPLFTINKTASTGSSSSTFNHLPTLYASDSFCLSSPSWLEWRPCLHYCHPLLLPSAVVGEATVLVSPATTSHDNLTLYISQTS